MGTVTVKIYDYDGYLPRYILGHKKATEYCKKWGHETALNGLNKDEEYERGYRDGVQQWIDDIPMRAEVERRFAELNRRMIGPVKK